MSAFETLRQVQVENSSQFEYLAPQYRRLGTDYAGLAGSALASQTLWDGAGHGAAETFWKQLMELERKREGVRVGDLAHLLNALEVAGEDYDKLTVEADRFVADKGVDPYLVQDVMRADLLRKYVIQGVTRLHKEAYAFMPGPYKKARWDEGATLKAQQELRFAVDLDR